MIGVAASIILVSAGSTTAPGEAELFDPMRDGKEVERCLGVYMTLGEAAAGLNDTQATEYQTSVGRGMRSINPYAVATSHAIGNARFYREAAMTQLDTHR